MCVCTAGMGGFIKEYGIAENISKKRRGSERLQQSDQGIESLTPRPKSYTSQVRKSKKVIPNLGTLDPIPGLESTRAITSSSLCRQPPRSPFPNPLPSSSAHTRPLSQTANLIPFFKSTEAPNTHKRTTTTHPVPRARPRATRVPQVQPSWINGRGRRSHMRRLRSGRRVRGGRWTRLFFWIMRDSGLRGVGGWGASG